jgi:hypothetical protein
VIVASRLDYANSVLYGVSQKNITRLQRVQNALACCVVNPTKSKVRHTSSVALLRQLHWLPIEYRIRFKMAKLAFLTRSSSTTAHFNSLVSSYASTCVLSDQQHRLFLTRYHLNSDPVIVLNHSADILKYYF